MPKILAIDYGTKNIGLALSDDEQKFSFAYNTINIETRRGTSLQQAWPKIISDIKNICKLENVEQVVVGMPVRLSGEKSKMSEQVFEFIRELQKKLGDIIVEVEDERWTTVQASRLQNKNARNVNELAAQILLQGYLDKMKFKN